jgi:hypothetical protein
MKWNGMNFKYTASPTIASYNKKKTSQTLSLRDYNPTRYLESLYIFAAKILTIIKTTSIMAKK